MTHSRFLVAFASKRGSARQAAEWIADELRDAEIVDLASIGGVDLYRYGTVVLGTGILAGKAYPPFKRFIKRYRAELAEKDICLFITHLEEGEGIERDFQSAFDAGFLKQVRVRAGVGGRVSLDRLNPIVRFIMRRIAQSAGKDFTDYDTLSREACAEFARKARERA
jgi:menaquinone-dependent protoporphyrinogen IX oxidase